MDRWHFYLLIRVRAWCRVLGEVLPSVLAGFGPDIVLYDAGVDTHMHDSLGKLNLTDAGLRRRELQVCTCLYGSFVDTGVACTLMQLVLYGRVQAAVVTKCMSSLQRHDQNDAHTDLPEKVHLSSVAGAGHMLGR